MGNFLNCVQRPFVQGCTRESSWWMCEYTRVTAQVFYPECRGKCLSKVSSIFPLKLFSNFQSRLVIPKQLQIIKNNNSVVCF